VREINQLFAAPPKLGHTTHEQRKTQDFQLETRWLKPETVANEPHCRKVQSS
jgi:hypothetical protein